MRPGEEELVELECSVCGITLKEPAPCETCEAQLCAECMAEHDCPEAETSDFDDDDALGDGEDELDHPWGDDPDTRVD